MKDLHQKLKDAEKLSGELQKEHPEITCVWFHFENIKMDELRKESEIRNEELEYADYMQAISLHFTGLNNSTIFCYSKKVKIETHIVINSAIKNI